ncbi:hypothetical protein [Kineothrix sedimenti]|uniref:Uncharacterized protein n=1 Tax=Kineothrix sedimenti TaxID=3123317 RepID=A0ABZ3EU23_9FIRM
MNLELEKKKMKDILDKMTIKEFDDMLDNCGISEIKPSHMSDYFRCLSSGMAGKPLGYISIYNGYDLNYYGDYNDFDLEGQDVA